MKWRHMGTGLLVLPLVVLLGHAVYAAIIAWGMAGDVEIGSNGIIALVLGVVFTLALAGGLIWLLIYSLRHGYDQ
jgi:hypothetical protein